jgi:hypothetical protein
MSLLKGLKTEAGISTKESDSLGGGSVVDSGIYKEKIVSAFLGKSKGGALSVTVELANKVSTVFWITSGDAKGNLPYYLDKEGKKNYLPGFLQINALCEMVTGKSVNALDTEEKVIKKYDYESKAEVPTKVDMIMDLVGATVNAGVVRQTVNKKTKTDAGYVATADTRDENEIIKFFNEDGLSHTEMQAKVATNEASVMNKWIEKFAGKTLDKTEKVAANAPKAGAPAAATQASVTDDLFGED